MMDSLYMEYFKKGLRGELTDEEYQYYLDHFMSDEEIIIGKPSFEMTDEETKRFNVMTFNASEGELEGYDCAKCKNKGWIQSVDENGYVFETPCECQAIRDSIENIKASGLEALMNDYTFDNYQQNEDWQKYVFKKAHEFLEDNASMFVILGKTGCGKTMICTAICSELLKQGLELKYMLWVDESMQIKQNANVGEEYKNRVEQLKNTQVLYIDDFLKGEPTSADMRLAMEIINYRYNKSRDKRKRYITILSSERTLEQLFEYDEAVAGRIKEMAGNYLISIKGDGKNYRLKGGTK